jgi:hypothetical protein
VRDARGVDGIVAPGELVGVADGAVDHEAGNAALPRPPRHELADDRVVERAASVDHEHIARPGDVDRLVHHQVVAGGASSP